VGAIAQTADKVAHAIRLIAAEALEAPPDKIEFKDGYVKVADGSNRGMPLRRIAARAHWNPNGLPAGVSPGIYASSTLSPPSLASPDAQDRIPSAVTYGFVIDLVAVEIERATGAIRIDKYVSVHDVGRQLNPRIVEGQVHGGLAHGLGAALMEELAYDAGGNFLAGTFADYLCPTAMEMPSVTIGHVETRSPMNVLGAKGMGDGSSMLTPAAIANAVADALGRDDITLPLTLERVWALANDVQPPRRTATTVQALTGGLRGQGTVTIAAPPSEVWRRLIDPAELARIVPGCKDLQQVGPDRYRAEVMIGVAGIRGLYAAEIELRDKQEPTSVRLVGKATGALGFGAGEGVVTLIPQDGGTRLSYSYGADVGGKLAAVGQRLLGTVTRVLIAEFFGALERRIAPRAGPAMPRWLAMLLALLGRKTP
jgi:2-furoyl-CoA dehydrogenase large subunit